LEKREEKGPVKKSRPGGRIGTQYWQEKMNKKFSRGDLDSGGDAPTLGPWDTTKVKKRRVDDNKLTDCLGEIGASPFDQGGRKRRRGRDERPEAQPTLRGLQARVQKISIIRLCKKKARKETTQISREMQWGGLEIIGYQALESYKTPAGWSLRRNLRIIRTEREGGGEKKVV